MDIGTFLNARLNEDEQLAQDADTSPEMITGIPRSYAAAPVAFHIARHNPPRVLADVDAKRRIIRWHFGQPNDTTPYGEPVTICHCGYDLPCTTLRLLALPYADHPDYQQEWTP